MKYRSANEGDRLQWEDPQLYIFLLEEQYDKDLAEARAEVERLRVAERLARAVAAVADRDPPWSPEMAAALAAWREVGG